jgi:hypothetical protein
MLKRLNAQLTQSPTIDPIPRWPKLLLNDLDRFATASLAGQAAGMTSSGGAGGQSKEGQVVLVVERVKQQEQVRFESVCTGLPRSC